MKLKRELTTLTRNETENVLMWLNNELPRKNYSQVGRRRIVELLDATKRLLDLTNRAGRRGHGITRWTKELIRFSKPANQRTRQYPAPPIVNRSPKAPLTGGAD